MQPCDTKLLSMSKAVNDACKHTLRNVEQRLLYSYQKVACIEFRLNKTQLLRQGEYHWNTT